MATVSSAVVVIPGFRTAAAYVNDHDNSRDRSIFSGPLRPNPNPQTRAFNDLTPTGFGM